MPEKGQNSIRTTFISLRPSTIPSPCLPIPAKSPARLPGKSKAELHHNPRPSSPPAPPSRLLSFSPAAPSRTLRPHSHGLLATPFVFQSRDSLQALAPSVPSPPLDLCLLDACEPFFSAPLRSSASAPIRYPIPAHLPDPLSSLHSYNPFAFLLTPSPPSRHPYPFLAPSSRSQWYVRGLHEPFQTTQCQ